jgi:hypothetical protein
MNIWKIAALLPALLFIQPAAAASWHEWDSLGLGMAPGPGGMKGNPAAVAWGPSNANLSVFVRGSNDALWWDTKSNGKWGGWLSLGGKISSAPSCASIGQSRILCFARGSDNAMWTTEFQTKNVGQWTTWATLGGLFNGAPSAMSYGTGDITVAARGTDNALWMRSLSGSAWSTGGWYSDGGGLVTDPACGEPAGDISDPQSIAAEGNTFHAACYAMGNPEQMDQWQTYFSSPGGQTGPVLVLNNPDAITHAVWTKVGGRTAYQGSLVYETVNAQYLFVAGTDNVLWRGSWLVQSGWKWESLGGLPNMGSGPSCVRQGSITNSTWTCFAMSIFGFLMERRYQ